MYRTHTCGQLRYEHINTRVALSGWVQRIRELGGMTFIDLRDQYGITQLAFSKEKQEEFAATLDQLGREFVIKAEGTVIERASKNPELPTGDIEIDVNSLTVLSKSETPPFTIEDNTDGGEELRMKYRYLDLRRNAEKEQIILRNRVNRAARDFLEDNGFTEVETPFLIRSTPEGARDFIVPSRLHPGNFYALPQSPQTFKQLLMVGGFDRYYQVVKCFRDEDFRADRQPEFTQIDCEMAFVDQEDVMEIFENMLGHILKNVKDQNPGKFPRMTWREAMETYGTDRPDMRFDMPIVQMDDTVKGKGFNVFDKAEYAGGIVAKGCGHYSRKQMDKLTEFVTSPQIGAKGLVYLQVQEGGTFKSSAGKFYDEEDFKKWMEVTGAEEGDLILILAGEKWHTLNALGELRLEMARRLELQDPEKFVPLWVVDFPLLEQDEETGAWHPNHHPFTSPRSEDIDKLNKDPGNVMAEAYDLVLNGFEIAGGSIRIHDKALQEKLFEVIGISQEEAQQKFGFLLEAFQYGAPPHGGIAFGFDRLCAVLGGKSSIRETIAFPKNNSGRDLMIDAPSSVDKEQLDELHIGIKK